MGSKRKDRVNCAIGMGIVATLGVAACSAGPAMPRRMAVPYAQKNASKTIKAADLGEVPGGLIDPQSELVPLLPDSGGTFTAKSIKDSKITVNVAEKKTCGVKTGTVVSLIAKNGSYLRVLSDADCGGEAAFVEGFIPQDDVEEERSEPTPTKTHSGTNSVLIATQSNGGDGSSNANVANANQGAGSDSTLSGCSKVSIVAWKQYAFNLPRSPTIRDPNLLSECGGTRPLKSCTFPGEWFRYPEQYRNLDLKILGTAVQWKIRTDVGMSLYGGNRGREYKKEKTVPASVKEQGVSIIKMEDVVERNTAFNATVTWTVQGLDAASNLVGGECVVSARLVSPIVLDLANMGRFDGTEVADSRVKFDLTGTGIVEQTGWVNPTMGLLAWDRNGNGKIDDGTELFGEATRLSDGNKASNGYVALAELDSNRDGLVTSADASFKNLVVWVDGNSDGVTDRGELRSLASLAITRIGLAYSPSHRHGPVEMFANDVRYEARYWGPASCGVKGCLSFDVYFSTVKTVSVNRR